VASIPTDDDREHNWVDPANTRADIRDHLDRPEANTYAGAS
jgi:hypothetical protein